MRLRALTLWELGFSLLAGVATLVLTMAILGPWADLLGEDARQMGQLGWYVELFKSFVPLALGFGVALGIILFLQKRPPRVEPGIPLRADEMSTPRERVERAVREEVAIRPYDPGWADSFRREREHLRRCLPSDLVGRIEHFGSTAVPGLAAKPIVDILVEVTDLQATRERIAPLLEAQGYEYFWRPTHGDDGPPFYAWFIKRNPNGGDRTHHIHMVDATFSEHWDRLLFRDYLIEHPEVAREYEQLKVRLASAFPHDRVAYTQGKSEFIARVTDQAKRFDASTA